MKKTISKILFGFLILSLFLTVAPAPNKQVTKAAKKKATIIINIKDNEESIKNAGKKIHKSFMNNKQVSIKVSRKIKGKKFRRLIDNVSTEVGMQNKQAVGFTYETTKKTSKYTYSRLCDARTYKYTVKFVKKMYSITRNMLLKQETNLKFYEDYKKYNDLDTLKMQVLYDKLSSKYQCNGEYQHIIGFQEPTTNLSVYITRDSMNSNKMTKLTKAEEKDLLIKAEGTMQTEYNDTITYAEFNSFDEFAEQVKKHPKALKAVAHMSRFGEFEKNCYLDFSVLSFEEHMSEIHIMETENFCDLPKATRLYAIDKSYYFSCQFKGSQYSKNVATVQGLKKPYCMYYSFDAKPAVEEWQKAKALYKGKAAGVCWGYANYETLLFRMLGFETFLCTKFEINHAYTVLTFKNSKGKTLWVPFDYGIGPSSTLRVTKKVREKYLATEKMRYKLYLKGIKGAPKKKNFTMADFV